MNRIVFSDLQWMRVAPQQAFSRAPVRYPTVLRSTPIPSIAISTVIPVRIGRTPTEVPQAIRSPRGIVTVTGAGRRKPPPSPHYRHRFPAEIISHAVWLYRVFSLSLRDVGLLLAERGVVVSYESVRRRCGKFGARFASCLRRRRGHAGVGSRSDPAVSADSVGGRRPRRRRCRSAGKLNLDGARGHRVRQSWKPRPGDLHCD
jgi:putative transposase